MSGPAAKTEEDKKPADADNKGADKGDSSASPKPGTHKSTPMKIKGSYQAVPGASTTGDKQAKDHNALWFQPLKMAPLDPNDGDADSVVKAMGVSEGGGETLHTFSAPLKSDGGPDDLVGTGKLTAELKYASDLKSSYSVSISGEAAKDKKAALTAAKTYVDSKILDKNTATGDISTIETGAASALADQGFANVKVTIQPIGTQKSLADAGRSEIFYKARNAPTILLDVPTVATGEKSITSTGGTTKTSGGSVDSNLSSNTKETTTKVNDKKTDNSVDTTNKVQTNVEQSAQTSQTIYTEVITEIENTVADLTKNLIPKLHNDNTVHTNGSVVEHIDYVDVDKYKKTDKYGTKEGDDETKNWAQHISDVLGGVNDVIDGIIPIPGVSKYLRKLNEIGLAVDIGDKVAKRFAVKGKVHFKDIDASTDVDDKKSGNSTNKKTTDMTTKTTDDGKLTQDFKQHFTSFTSKAKTKLVTSTTSANQSKTGVATQSGVDTKSNTKTDDYNGSVKETNNNASVNAKVNQDVTTNLQYTVTSKETTTRPVLSAHVTAGDGEVAAAPFPALNTKPIK